MRAGMRGMRRWASTEATRLVIFDTTLRDGEQSPGCTLNTPEKLTIAKQLSKLGVDVCEAGFPIASDGDFEAVARIAEEVGPLTEGRHDKSTMTICGLSRATEKDIKRCYDAVKYSPKHRIHTFLATSDIHLKHKLQIDREECIKRAVKAVSYAASLTNDVEFSPEDAGRSDPDFLCRVLAAVIEAGATTLNIPDTVGYNTPQMYGALIKYLVENTKGAEKAIFSTHCHNDLGMATANTLAGVLNGCRQVEVTINGIGERAGNTSLEEIVMITETHKNLGITTNITTEQIYRTSQMVSAFTGMAVQANKAVVGANAFAHESGIHQDGMLKNRETYEIMTPQKVGVGSTNLVMGKHSGRNAFFSRLTELGYADVSEDRKTELFGRFKALADVKKVVTESDLHALVQEDSSRVKEEEIYELKTLQLSAGNINTATVEVYNKKEETSTVDAAIGNGPVDAIVCALSRITGTNYHLKTYEVKAVQGSESDSMGEVIVRIRDDANTVTVMGRGLDVDILKATGKAYINAVNKMLGAKPQKAKIETP
eukprot:TRINITY_DN1861_c0_g7_i1.p1 TRINITY_DN1861_c0_g7~~TRINITY_DN1861_c0_g7_i1.p1  ORF type:complete len:541 (+),score=180.04 TRINITY_DN1861_c0_g7_i1:51-1673(+)